MTTDRLFQDFVEVTVEHAMPRSGSDPISEDLAELDARAEEEAREVLWDAFVEAIKARKAALHHWSDVLGEVHHALMCAEAGELDRFWWFSFEKAVSDFAESEGWPAVLQAIARAMIEQAKAHS